MLYFLKATGERFAARGELVVKFWMDERAQDITEYTLLLSFVVLAAAAIFVINGASMANIWGDANGLLGQASIRATNGS